MTNPGNHEGRTDEPSIEEQVMTIFHDSKRALCSGEPYDVDLQNENVSRAVGGKRIVVTTRLDVPWLWRPISPSDGQHSIRGISNPREVSGIFSDASVSAGVIFLEIDGAKDAPEFYSKYKYWAVNIFGGSAADPETRQLVDIRIEGPELPGAA